MGAYSKEKTPLTEFDIENWWGYLMREYPRNYWCARQYYTDEDEDLASIGRKPGEFDVNDYFTICQLPRITAVNGIIKVDGKVVKRYSGFRDWKIKRIQFEKLKHEPIFGKWKWAQYICQDKKCAWCREPIEFYGYKTQVDHVVPLYYDGDNEYRNMVLTCEGCNKHKGVKTAGYNNGMNERIKNEIPKWIKRNYYNRMSIPYFEVTEQEIEEFDRCKKRYSLDDDADDETDEELPF